MKRTLTILIALLAVANFAFADWADNNAGTCGGKEGDAYWVKQGEANSTATKCLLGFVDTALTNTVTTSYYATGAGDTLKGVTGGQTAFWTASAEGTNSWVSVGPTVFVDTGTTITNTLYAAIKIGDMLMGNVAGTDTVFFATAVGTNDWKGVRLTE